MADRNRSGFYASQFDKWIIKSSLTDFSNDPPDATITSSFSSDCEAPDVWAAEWAGYRALCAKGKADVRARNTRRKVFSFIKVPRVIKHDIIVGQTMPFNSCDSLCSVRDCYDPAPPSIRNLEMGTKPSVEITIEGAS